MRSTGHEAGWLAAVTERYKLIYSTSDSPWLFDLQADPDELTNFFADPAYREIVRNLSRQLLNYGTRHQDPRAANPTIQAGLQWAMEAAEDQSPTP